ncbi:MAG: response regulator, partial [Caldilineae bacterium]
MSTILIIDDDVNALKLLAYTLRKAGFDILVAQNGFEGLEKAEQHLPDLVVSDLMMPKMDGYEVTRRLRANPATRNIPIIMLTAKSQVQDKVAGFEAGVDDYVTKPV